VLTPEQRKWIDKQPSAQVLMRALVKAKIPFLQYKEIVEYYQKKDKRDNIKNKHG
jgi:hypothetical protein